MKRFVKLFIVILILLFFVTLFLRTQKVLSYRYDCGEFVVKRKEHMLSLPDNSLDVVFIGSSGLYAGVSPGHLWSRYNITSYNLSTSNQPFIVRYYNVLELLQKQQPKVVILDVTLLTSVNDSPLNTFYEVYYRMGFNDINDVILRYDYLRTLKQNFPELITYDYVFPFFKFHLNWDEISKKNYIFQEEYDNYKMGSLYSKKVKEVTFDDNHMQDTGEGLRGTNPYHIEYLQKLVNLCEENDIDILLVITPRVNLTLNRLEVMQDKANQLRIPLINYSTEDSMSEMSLDLATDFYNEGHVNIWGNRKFTEQLGSDLIKLKPDLPRQSMENCESWVEAAYEYEQYYQSLDSP